MLKSTEGSYLKRVLRSSLSLVALQGLASLVGCGYSNSNSASSSPTTKPTVAATLLPLPSSAIERDVSNPGVGSHRTTLTFGPVRVTISTDVSANKAAQATLVTASRAGKDFFSNASTWEVMSVGFLPKTATRSALLYFGTFSGGAHCCAAVLAVHVDANEAGYHDVAEQDLGDFPIRWRQLRAGGPFILVAGDDDIAYKFGSFADTHFPIKLYEVSDDKFIDVTDQYPELLEKDAAADHTDWLKLTNVSAAVAEIADLLRLNRLRQASSEYADLQSDPRAPLIRQWLIARGYGDPAQQGDREQTATTPVSSSRSSDNASADTTSDESGTVPQEHPVYVPPATSGVSCESVSVVGVYSDGEILELDDGRHLKVDPTDTVTSAVWVAPFDALICDDGDKLINKEDNESVDLSP